ncbi:hypothetical protein DP117_12500 [Brasilonema sp. UFV-L1]|nr:hypothetical protein [Brasilonema sp. UFV-L1]
MINWGSPYVSKPFKWHFSDEVLHEKNGEGSKPHDLSWGRICRKKLGRLNKNEYATTTTDQQDLCEASPSGLACPIFQDQAPGQHRSIYKPSPFFRGQMRDHMLEKVRLNQLQEWWRCTSQKENKGILLQTNCYLYCYRRHCSHFLVTHCPLEMGRLNTICVLSPRLIMGLQSLPISYVLDPVNQIASYLDKPKIVKIILKRRDTYQLKQKTSTIAKFYHCKNTSKVVAKHTYSSVRVIGYGYGTFLQAWNTLGELY